MPDEHFNILKIDRDIPGFICSPKIEVFVSFFAWVLLSAYVWLLPILAQVFDKNNDRYYCNTPTEYIYCSNHKSIQNITSLVSDLACGCSEGVFGQHVCPLGEWGFTISEYSSTTTGTVLFALFSLIPIRTVWVFIVRHIQLLRENNCDHIKICTCILWIYTLLLTLSWVGVLCTTVCHYRTEHAIFVLTFMIVSSFLYIMIIITHNILNKTHSYRHALLWVTLIIQTVSFASFIVAGMTFKLRGHQIEWLSWFFECVAITCGFFIPVLLQLQLFHL